MSKARTPVAAYSVAIFSVGLGIALPMLSKPFVGQSAPWVSFTPAVLLSAWYGGFTPGLVTTGLLLLSPIALEDVLFTSSGTPAARIFGALMFLIAALAICLVTRAMRLAQTAALDAAAAARAAEAGAQAERDWLEVILRDLPVGVLIATEDRAGGEGRVELVNPAAASILGTSARPGADLLSHLPVSFRTASGEELGPRGWPIQRSLRHQETIVNEEFDILRRDGLPRTVMINSRPVQGSSGEGKAVTTYSDVTSLRAAQKALRASEARLRRLFDSPIIGVVSGDGDVAGDANDCFLRMLGYSREALQEGALRFSALTPPELHAIDERIGEQLAQRGFSDPVSKELLAADGRHVPVMVGTTALEPGQSSSWIAWVLDLSEHRKLEERVRQAAKAESIGLLAGGVAHDFNNLLTIIMGNLSLAHAMLPDDGEGRLRIENAVRAGERATDLTRQLLAYAGKGQFIVQPADVSGVILDIAKLFRASAAEGVDIQLDLPRGLPLVNADAIQIQQLVMNLVINGVESLDGRPGVVRVSTSAIDLDEEFLQSAALVADTPPGRYVRIIVTDNGCGMDAETRQRIFDPFFTTKFTGRGLGLAAAAGIVRAHRGGMVVHSSPGQGSAFEVFLPEAAATGAAPARGAVVGNKVAPATSFGI